TGFAHSALEAAAVGAAGLCRQPAAAVAGVRVRLRAQRQPLAQPRRVLPAAGRTAEAERADDAGLVPAFGGAAAALGHADGLRRHHRPAGGHGDPAAGPGHRHAGAGLGRVRGVPGRQGLLALPVGWHFLMPYQRDRILTFLDPESDPLGAGWNIIQSKIAIGSGGLTGKGWGQGSQSHLDFLPEHTTDFVFSVLAEEWGWAGVVAVLALYLFVIGRSLWMAAQARDGYSRLLAGS